jgi:hypothetical protein
MAVSSPHSLQPGKRFFIIKAFSLMFGSCFHEIKSVIY